MSVEQHLLWPLIDFPNICLARQYSSLSGRAAR